MGTTAPAGEIAELQKGFEELVKRFQLGLEIESWNVTLEMGQSHLSQVFEFPVTSDTEKRYKLDRLTPIETLSLKDACLENTHSQLLAHFDLWLSLGKKTDQTTRTSSAAHLDNYSRLFYLGMSTGTGRVKI